MRKRSIICTSLKTEGKTKKVGSNVIVINGKHYDAKTGRLIETSKTSKPSHSATPTKQNGPSIDGFSRRTNTPKPSVTANAVHSKTEKSKTLMRGAVKKPIHSKVHATAHANQAKHQPLTHINHTPENLARVARATTATKSNLISRFGSSPSVASVHKTTRQVAVKQAPGIQNHSTEPLPILPSNSNTFQQAIDNATSHNQTKLRKSSKRQRIAHKLRISPKMVSFGSFILAGMLLGGFFVYQNIPNLAMRVASTRSGVAANLPSYKPSGFSLNGPIKYSAGQITVNYHSNSDDRAYKVTQSSSEWNSETLLDKFVASNQRAYQAYQDKGKTIYMYDGSNATWVERGVWYQIEGASSLSSDQLLRIANSL